MKKIILGLILSSLLMIPLVSLAETELPDSCKIDRYVGIDECDDHYDSSEGGGAKIEYECKMGNVDLPCGLCCLLNIVYEITDWVFIIMMALAVILVVAGGATYMLAVGDPDKAAKGKTMITFAIIGLAIALIARFVPPVVKHIMGVNETTTETSSISRIV